MLGQRRQLIRGEAPACSLAKFMHCIYPSPITLTRHIYHIINPEDYHQKSIKQQHASLRSAINYICSAEKKKRLKKRRAGGDKEAGADHKAHAAFNKHADDAVIHHIINGAALLPPGRLGATPDWRHAHFLRPPVLIGRRGLIPGLEGGAGGGGAPRPWAPPPSSSSAVIPPFGSSLGQTATVLPLWRSAFPPPPLFVPTPLTLSS